VNLLTASMGIVTLAQLLRRPGITRKAPGNPTVERLPRRHPEVAMPLLDRIRAFLSGPQGRRLTEHGRRYASDPRNQDRARNLLARLRRR
jgi:hypothetical protein